MNNIQPSISIITVVYNDVEGIIKTIESVIGQSFKDYEFIIVDGLSSDGTSERILEYNKYISKYMSEKDDGIADAFNKGLSQAVGKWVYFLNSGDYLIDMNILKTVYSNFLIDSEFDVVSGKVIIVDSKGNSLGYSHPNSNYNINEIYKRNIIAHQASFVKLSLYTRIGNFKDYKIHMDYDFWIRAKKLHGSFFLIDLNIANFSTDGVSSQRKNYIKARKEMLKILCSYRVISKWKFNVILFKDSTFYYIKSVLRIILGKKRSNLISNYRLKRE